MNEDIKKLIEYAERIPHFHADFPIILFWSHRSGCTSLANWFFFQIGLYEKAMEYAPFIHYYESNIYKNRNEYYEDLEVELLKLKKDTIKLVRNPYKRPVSSFLVLYDNPYSLKQWEEIREYFYNDKNSPKGISFKQFLYYLKDIGPNSSHLDQHFSQQYIEGEEKIIKQYIKLENFNTIIPKLEKEYGLLSSDISLLTNSSHHRAHQMIYKGNYADKDITNPQFPSLPTYRSFYDEQAIKLVSEIFTDDFEIYGYKKGDICF
ncbi:sulfotransferase family 2 domain-containing protein [Bacillus cereus]|uniref:sulfotransferase family 2 domain-containing protein n=1 Tax=Bacillus cereus TaxID=1396 RepID=UPI0018F33828|nr:sulfotransferase family 2 domain-containing protein [Bacillus cereus]MBJ7967886.1 sulfotransferase family 2 domain-containing protein [Bacillus cereus]MBJ8004280.1 sulfotransferase family 2 domain-containing protein [Bacillus cereus]